MEATGSLISQRKSGQKADLFFIVFFGSLNEALKSSMKTEDPKEPRPPISDFYVGRWLVQPSLNRVTDAEKSVKVAPKIMEVLVCLAERPGQVVTKEQLMQAVWRDTFVGDSALARTISELRKVFADESGNSQVIETIPKSGYRLIAPVSRNKPETSEPASLDNQPQAASISLARPTRGHRAYFTAAFLLALLGLSISVWYFFRRDPTTLARSLKITPVTAFQGHETEPALSPDGEKVAFVWDGSSPGQAEIYVKPINAETVLRLTDDPNYNTSPTWSPDGNYIAFARHNKKDVCGIYVVPAIAGAERKLTSCEPGRIPKLSWSPDGQWLALSSHNPLSEAQGILLLSVTTLERRTLTTPAEGLSDSQPTFSPDGKMLAFTRLSKMVSNDIYLVPVSGGEPVRLTFDNYFIRGLDWSPDGQSIYFASGRGEGLGLWEVSIKGGALKQTGLMIGGDEIEGPSLARQKNRLVFGQKTNDWDLQRLELSSVANMPSSSVQFISSTSYDGNAQFSPDGQKIAFLSNRRGHLGLWVCDRDGSHPMQLTSLANFSASLPSWSPDAKHIVYSNQADIHVIESDGGVPRRLTANASRNVSPLWSRDGKWIYFTSDRGGTYQVWKMAASGGEATQLTKKMGWALFESSDGKLIYYFNAQDGGVWQVPSNGGEERFAFKFSRGNVTGDCALVDGGIYFINREVMNGRAIDFLDLTTHKVKRVALLEKAAKGLTVSPDRRTILYAQMSRSDSNLMLVENFR